MIFTQAEIFCCFRRYSLLDYITDGIIEAFRLLYSLNRDLYSIIFLSILVSSAATLMTTLTVLPLGIALGLRRFRGEELFSRIIFSLMGIPSVVIGLIVALLLSRRSVLGFLQLLYTPGAMVIAQTLLITPLAMGLAYKLSKKQGRRIKNLGKTLGAHRGQQLLLVCRELRGEILVIVLTCFSRAITEVGAVMIVGGNIQNRTRVMTTAISMLNSMGDYSMGIALGLILFLVTFILNCIVYSIHRE